MSSADGDLQIQNLGIEYGKVSTSEPSLIRPATQSYYSPDSQADHLPWNKIQLVVHTFSMLVVVAVIGAAGFYSLSRLHDKKTLSDQTKAAAPINRITAEQTVASGSEMFIDNLTLTLPVDWEVVDQNHYWTEIYDHVNKSKLKLIPLQANSYLTADLTDEVEELLSELCQQQFLIAGVNQCQLAKGLPKVVPGFSPETYLAHLVPTSLDPQEKLPQNQPVFVTRTTNLHTNTLIVISHNNVPQDEIKQIIGSLNDHQ